MKKMAMVLVFCGFASAASADLVMQMQVEDHEEQSRQTSTIYLAKDRIRMESRTGGMDLVNISRMDRDLIWMVRPDRKLYAEISMSEMRRMHAEATAHEKKGKAMLEEKMAGMDPAEKAEYMAYLGMEEEEVPVEYVKKGQDRVGKWTCTVYEGRRGEQKEEEICTVSLKTLGLEEKDFEALRKMSVDAEGEGMLGGAEWKEIEKRGFPVRTILFDDGQATSTESMLTLEKKGAAASLFELPAGFQKVPMMSLYGE